MIPSPGQHVRVLFRNGVSMDGIVEEWYGNYAQLKSTTDESTIIITNPTQDIMVIKILPDEDSEEKEPIFIPDPPSEELEQVEAELHNELDLRNKKLADLKIMANEAERQIIANKLKSHAPGGYVPHKPNYGSQIDLLPRGRKTR